MTTLIERFKSEMKEARFARDQRSVTFFSTIIGELEGKAKLKKPVSAQIVTDEDVVTYIKKYIQTTKDNMRLTTYEHEFHDLQEDIDFLSQFVPQALTENQIKDILISNEFENLGQFMAHLKQHYAGRYDGKQASELFKGRFSL